MIVAFKTLFAVIKNASFSEQKIILGRWNTVYNRNILDKRVDLSNEDHCGPCGQYILQQNMPSSIPLKFVEKKN